jgi:hypothetical protein
MSCAAVTVNRSLILMAAMWGVISMAIFQAVTLAGTDDTVALHGMRESEHPHMSRPVPPSERLSCQLEGTGGLLPALSLAISQPNKKKASVTNGR